MQSALQSEVQSTVQSAAQSAVQSAVQSAEQSAEQSTVQSHRLHTTPHKYTSSWQKYKVLCCATPSSCEDEYQYGLDYDPSDNTE